MGALFSCIRNLRRSIVELKRNVKDIKVTLCSIHQLLSGMVGLVKDVEEISGELRLTVTKETRNAKHRMSENLELVLSTYEEEYLFHLSFYDDVTRSFEDYLEKIYDSDIRTPTKLVVISETVSTIRDGLTILRTEHQSALHSNLLSTLAHYIKSRARESKKKFLNNGAKAQAPQRRSFQGQSSMFCYKNSFINHFHEELIVHLHEAAPQIKIEDVQHFLQLKNRLRNGYPTFASKVDFKKRKEYLQKMKGVLSKTVKSVRQWNSSDDLLLLAKAFDFDLKTAAEKMLFTEKSFHKVQVGIINSLRQARGHQESGSSEASTCKDQIEAPDLEDDAIPHSQNDKLSESIDSDNLDILNVQRTVQQYLNQEKIEEMLAVVGNNLDSLPSLLGESELVGVLTQAINSKVVDKLVRSDNCPTEQNVTKEVAPKIDSFYVNNKTPASEAVEKQQSCCPVSSDPILQSACQNEEDSIFAGDFCKKICRELGKEGEVDTQDRLQIGNSEAHEIWSRLKGESIIERLLQPSNLANMIKLSIIDVPKSALMFQKFKDKSEMVQLTARLVSPVISDLMSNSPRILQFYAEDGQLKTLTAHTVYELLKVVEDSYLDDDCIKRAAKKTAKKQLLLPLCSYLKQITVDNVLE